MGTAGFWMHVYIAAIRSGQTSYRAVDCADDAVESLKVRLIRNFEPPPPPPTHEQVMEKFKRGEDPF